MKDFGFGLKKSSVILLDEVDFEVSKKIASQEPSLNVCINCGSCTATCTAGKFTGFSLRRMQLLVRRGQFEEVKNRMKECMLCGKCQWVCPKGVNTRHIVLLLNKEIDARKIR